MQLGEGTGTQGGGLSLEVETRPHQVAVCRSHGSCFSVEGFGTQEVSFLILQDFVLSSALSCRQLDGGISLSTLTV